jgi:hypothetical protein
MQFYTFTGQFRSFILIATKYFYPLILCFNLAHYLCFLSISFLPCFVLFSPNNSSLSFQILWTTSIFKFLMITLEMLMCMFKFKKFELIHIIAFLSANKRRLDMKMLVLTYRLTLPNLLAWPFVFCFFWFLGLMLNLDIFKQIDFVTVSCQLSVFSAH